MRKGFTLIELIFVIVIIGLLAAVAVPKFVNLKQNAQASSVVKTTIDTAQQAVEAAVNHRDLEDDSNFHLKDLVQLNGKGWSLANDDEYDYKDPANSSTVAKIILHSSDNKVEYSINCDNFDDNETKTKCKDLIGQSSIDVNLSY